MLPKVISEARRIARGRAVGTERERKLNQQIGKDFEVKPFSCQLIDIIQEKLQKEV